MAPWPRADDPIPVLLIEASRANVYTGNRLDRVSARREDGAWVAAALADPSSLFVPVWRARSLLRGAEQGQPEAVLIDAGVTARLGLAADGWALLGIDDDGRAVFAVDLSAAEDPAERVPADIGSFADLRTVAGLLAGPEAALLAHARALMHWRSRHGFCGVCGRPCEPVSAGHVMRCTGCGTSHFPRTDPAVIMLVTDGERALLGHSQRFPNTTMYSTLAGFVEPGESLEEAVAREVHEEAGVRVGRVRYHSSQPWPFPSSIMLGFYAEALSHTITIDPEELSDARWFSRAELRDHAALGFSLPRADSIARRLIEDWIAAA
ncbi:MAG: NAD(+) diphosphatase [Rhodospirillales bacterium]|nr:NAD(+) diphosphatase [Rhodospirillales bacterium]